MTDIASYFMSPYGPYAETVSATKIPSRQAALRYGWFRDATDNCPAVYVRRSRNGRTQHFRRLESLIHTSPEGDRGEAAESPVESPEHIAVKRAVVEAVNKALADGESMAWGFRDRRFRWPFHGDLLCGVTAAVEEHTMRFPDGRIIRPDAALLGTDHAGAECVRWAVEVMRGNELNVEKMMKIYSMGLPTVVLDISGVAIDGIDTEWARRQLLATCADDPHGRRPNFIHLPDTMRTVLNDWSLARAARGEQHKFVVFGEESRILRLRDKLKGEAERLGLPFTRAAAEGKGMVHTDIAAPNNTNDQTEREFRNARCLVSDGWVELTGDRYLRILVPRPTGPGAVMDFHLVMAHLFAADGEVIVGYSSRGLTTDADDRNVCVMKIDKRTYEPTYLPFAPKVLCFPIGLHGHAFAQM